MADGKADLPAIEILPPATGRPTSYDPAFCERVQELGGLGYSRAQIAADLGVSRETTYNWEKVHPEFLDAMTRARDLALAWWEHAGQRGMFMTGFSANAWGLQVRNRFPEDYREKREVDSTVQVKNDAALPRPDNYDDWLKYQQHVDATARPANGSDSNGNVH